MISSLRGSGWRRGLRTKGPLVRDLAWSPFVVALKAKFQCHPARCLLPVEIMERCGLATGPATVELLPYLLPY